MVFISTKKLLISGLIGFLFLTGAIIGIAKLSYTNGRKSVYTEQSKTAEITLVNSTGGKITIPILTLCAAIQQEIMSKNESN